MIDIPLTGIRFAGAASMLAVAILTTHAVLNIDFRVPLREQIEWFQGSVRRFVLGISLVSYGWAGHQFYWWLAEVGRVNGGAIWDKLIAWSDVTVVFYMVVYVGVALVMSGWLASKVGRAWPLMAVIVIAVLLIIGARHG